MDQQELAQQLLAQAREQGIELVGPDGLLNRLTKNVLETALEAEMDQHVGYSKHDVSGRGSGNSRNGTRAKIVMTKIGPVEIDVRRDTGSTFDPQIVKKRQRRLTGVDEIVLSVSAKGLTTGEIAAHFGEVFGARVSKDTISRMTEKVIAEMTEWQNRPWTGSTRWCSSTRSTSRSATGRSRTGRSTSRSAAASTANATSSGYGPGTAAKARNSGSRC